MNDQIVLITGAGGGLGTHVTRAFLESGATVAGSSKRIQDADFPHPRFAAIPADLTDGDSARRLAGSVMERFQRIDVLVHLMGGFAGGHPIPDTGEATWDLMMNLNLRSAFHILRAVIPHMRQAGHGRIIAVGSRAAVEPQPGIAAYSASKAALVSLVRTAALENKDAGITANVILPGTIDTEANRKADPSADRSTWISPDHLAALIRYLASDEAGAITGAAIPVYGRGA
jgi:NAD(P)-dependent dehydrogenase (short-subunit alcohol dehydrogenase family)